MLFNNQVEGGEIGAACITPGYAYAYRIVAGISEDRRTSTWPKVAGNIILQGRFIVFSLMF